MSPELEHQLFDKFPRCFARHDAEDAQFQYGITCEDGWYALIESACQQIEAHLVMLATQSCDVPLPRIVQIKEKFGTLRINMRPTDAVLSRIREEALRLSESVCEECGVTLDREFSSLGGSVDKQFCVRCVSFQPLCNQ